MSAPGGRARPPRWMSALLLLIRDPELRELIAGDLEEDFARHAEHAAGARRWYLSQVIRTLLVRGSRRSRTARVRGTEGRTGGGLDALAADLRAALRGLRARTGTTLVIAGALALGVGVNAATFGIADAVLFRPLPYPEPDRIVWLHAAGPEPDDRYNRFTSQDVARLRDGSLGLSALGGYSSAGRTLEMEGIEPIEVDFARVTEGFFESLGARVAHGRIFTSEEARDGHPVVILSHAFWTSRLGADPAAVGRDLLIRGSSHRVVGVAEPVMTFPAGAAFWRPLTPDERADDDRELLAIGRIADGVTLTDVTALLASVSSEVVPSGEDEGPYTVWAESLRSTLVNPTRAPLLVLLGGAWLVLLIACANVANLLLALGEGRRRALAMHAALGAPRGRLIRMQFLETGVLALLSGLVGVAAGKLALPFLVALAPADTPRIGDASIDLRTLVAMGAVVAATTLIAGILPALSFSSVAPREAMTAPGRRATTRLGGGGGGRRWLVSAQVALSTMLAIGAALLVATVAEMATRDPGFDPEGLLAVELFPAQEAWRSRGGLRSYNQAAVETLRSAPGVAGIAFGSHTPEEGRGINAAIFGLEVADVPGSALEGAGVVEITPEYPAVAGIGLLAGRSLDASDGPESARVALINAAAAARYLGAAPRDAVGRRLTAVDLRTEMPGEVEIVGILADVRPDPRGPARPLVYLPYAQSGIALGAVLVRSAGDATSIVPELRARLHAFDAGLPLNRISRSSDALLATRASPRFIGLILTAFGSLALILALLGTYGVTSYSVARRTAEFGLRRALGASTGQVAVEVLRGGGVPIALGLAIGVGGAALGSRMLASLLFGVERFEPGVYAAVAGSVGLAALLAAWLPARRASRVDPMVALRAD